jgi:hypothetical protein
VRRIVRKAERARRPETARIVREYGASRVLFSLA